MARNLACAFSVFVSWACFFISGVDFLTKPRYNHLRVQIRPFAAGSRDKMFTKIVFILWAIT